MNIRKRRLTNQSTPCLRMSVSGFQPRDDLSAPAFMERPTPRSLSAAIGFAGFRRAGPAPDHVALTVARRAGTCSEGVCARLQRLSPEISSGLKLVKEVQSTIVSKQAGRFDQWRLCVEWSGLLAS